jgi:membrane protease YdiL (CAAX protease family)
MNGERNRDFPNLWQALLVWALLLGVQLLIGAAFHDAGWRFSAGDPKYGGVITVLGCGIVFSLLMGYKNLSYGALFHPSSTPASTTIGPLVAPLLLTTAGSVILAVEVNNALVHVHLMSQSELDMFVRMFSGGFVSVVTLCVIAPFVEEMLFRGLFLRSFLWNYSTGRSIVLSALLFGLAHLNVYQFVIASMLGLLSGWLYVVTRSLWPPILEHASYNAGVMLYYSFSDQEARTAAASSIPAHSPVVLLLAAAAFVLGVRWMLRILRPPQVAVPRP